MNTKVERGVSCRNDGDVNLELTAPCLSISTFTGDSVLPVWEECLPALRLSAHWSRGEFLPEDILSLLLARKALLWVLRFNGELHLTIITEVVDRPRKRICRVYALAGKSLGKIWPQAFPHFRDWFQMNRIDEIEAVCRDSVMRRLARIGFRKSANVLTLNWKELL